MADKIEKLQFLINKNIKDNNWTIIHKYADKMLALATEIQNEEKIYEAEYIIATSLHNMNLLEEAKKMWDQCEKKYCVDYFYETVNDICEYIDLETIIQDYQVINLFEEIQKPTNERPPVDEDYKRETQKVFIKNVKITYNIGGNSGSPYSTVLYIRRDGTNGDLENRIIYSNETFFIEEEIEKGSVLMSGRFKVVSYELCETTNS